MIICVDFSYKENKRKRHISSSRTMTVCRRLQAGLPVYFMQHGGARRWSAREHPNGPCGDDSGRCAREKAAQAGYPHQGLPGLRKPRRGFVRLTTWVGLGRKSRRTHSLKGIVPEVAAHVSVLLGLLISDGLTSFQTDSNTHQQVSGQGSCCPCCAIGPLTSSPAASRASSSLVS